MKSKTTGIWLLIAALLFAFIWFFQKHLQPPAPVVARLLPDLRAADVTGIQLSPAGEREISVIRSNGDWQLQKPLVYPAQDAAVTALASALEKLAVAKRISAAEIQTHTNSDAEYGFDNPQFTLAVESGNQRQQLIIGNKTAPGDQVFVRRVGESGAYVVDAGWLQYLPHSATAWRDTTLVNAFGVCDWIVITNGTKTMEFRYDAASQAWRMIRPLQARADGAKLVAALQQLRAGKVSQFVSDDPRADLSSYGLQPAELDIWVGRGTNMFAGILVGKNLPETNSEVYAYRAGWNSVLAVDKGVFAPWRGTVNDYRDTYLLGPVKSVAEIDVKGEKPFTLRQTESNTWALVGEKFPADAESVKAYLKTLSSLTVDFVKDVVTPADLQSFGLTPPSREIILRGKAGDTNSVLADLMFGATDTNRIFAKRGDEDFVYSLPLDQLARLPENGWEFRDRQIWDFSETNVVQVTLQQGGKTRQIIRNGENKWSLAPGSQGIINPPAIEETMHRLGSLAAAGWVGRNITDSKKYGLDQGNLSITVELKSGEKLSLDFGLELAQGKTALAAVTLDGERWAFVFPPVLYQFVATYLTIPQNTP